MPPGLSVIIVNYNSTALILQCIRSLIKNTTLKEWEIIVVDNSSKESPEEEIKEVLPALRFIQMSYNAGFARANNRGIEAAVYDTILLLNADTIISDDAISNAYQLLKESTYVACGVQLLNADGTTQIAGSRVMRGGLNYLLLLPYLGTALSWFARLAQVKKPSVEQAAAMEEVDWINGAFIMIKREAIRKAGMLDEDFFLYMEEIEWCSRLRKQGKLVLYGNINIIHLQGETTKDFFKTKSKGYQNLSNKMGRQLMLSIWLRQRKEFGIGWFCFLLLMYGIEIPVFFFLIFPARLFGNRQYSFADTIGYARNYCINLRYVQRIVRNHPFFYKVI